jgi:hypothetical protein
MCELIEKLFMDIKPENINIQLDQEEVFKHYDKDKDELLVLIGRLKAEYHSLLKLYDLEHIDEKSYIFNSVAVLEKNKVDVSELKEMCYEDILLNYLVSGRNCGHCAYHRTYYYCLS